jgi:putative glutamine amidotransferase
VTRHPVIGITAYEERARWGPWDEQAVLVPATYVHAVERAGGIAMVLPVQAVGVDELLDRVDGLVVSGGPDVDPSRYGEDAHPATQEPRPARDAYEEAVLDGATRRHTPVLAICRGLQVLNVARGGTLHQHLPDVVGHDRHSPHAGEYAWHPVEVEGRLARILGASTVRTASHHHQAIARVGRGLAVTGRAADGTIEAVEDTEVPFLLAVQWHPEAGDDDSLVGALVEAAGRYRAIAQPSQ